MIALPGPVWSIIMRFVTVGLAGALTLLVVATGLQAQRPSEAPDPRSAALVAQARQLRAAGNLDGAESALETAVAVDPRNRAAFELMGAIAEGRGLPGKAIRAYRAALELAPNDVGLLADEGRALVAQGAVDRAKANLARIRTLCHGKCPQMAALGADIAKGPPVQLSQAAPSPAPGKAD